MAVKTETNNERERTRKQWMLLIKFTDNSISNEAQIRGETQLMKHGSVLNNLTALNFSIWWNRILVSWSYSLFFRFFVSNSRCCTSLYAFYLRSPPQDLNGKCMSNKNNNRTCDTQRTNWVRVQSTGFHLEMMKKNTLFVQQFEFYYRCKPIRWYWFAILLNVKWQTKTKNCIFGQCHCGRSYTYFHYYRYRFCNSFQAQVIPILATQISKQCQQLFDGEYWTMNKSVLFFMAQRALSLHFCSSITHFLFL